MKIAVIGANGQLGSDIGAEFRRLGEDVAEINHDVADITDLDALSGALRNINPDVVINTAAFHNVDKCEADPQTAFAVNALGARNVATVTQGLNAFLIHISTDYVFNGGQKSPYRESDVPTPLNVYGNTKLAGEYFVRATAEKSLVMRCCGLYGKNPCRAKGYNFVDLMKKLARERDEVRVVDNEVLTPTSTLEVARQVVAVARNPIYGISHATAEGYCSWYEFAAEIWKIAGLTTPLNIAFPDEFPVKVPRPFYSVLENGLLKQYDFNTFKPWQDGLREYLEN